MEGVAEVTEGVVEVVAEEKGAVAALARARALRRRAGVRVAA